MSKQKKESNLSRQLGLLRDGRITFAQFASATEREMIRMAKHLMRRWVPPAWVEPEDVAQEILLGVSKHVWLWDPFYNKPLEAYVTWNAMGSAKRWLHKARGAVLSGSADRNPSRFEKPFSAFSKPGDDEPAEERMLAFACVEPEAEIALIEAESRREHAEEVLGYATAWGREAIVAFIATGSVEQAAMALYANEEARYELNLQSEEEAAGYVLLAGECALARAS